MDNSVKGYTPMYKIDNVNHPQHYKAPNGLEAIDVIEAFTADLNGFEATHTGNALKYLLRWKHKNGLEDLKKARWYISRLIEKLDPDEESKDEDELRNLINQSFAMEKFFFETEAEAREALDYLKDILRRYRRISVANVADAIGVRCTYIDNMYGWTTLDGVYIAPANDGYYAIILPKRKKFKEER